MTLVLLRSACAPRGGKLSRSEAGLASRSRRRGHVDSNRATGHPQDRPAFLFRNGVGIAGYFVPRISAELFPSECGSPPADAALSATRRGVYGLDRSAGRANRSGGSKP